MVICTYKDHLLRLPHGTTIQDNFNYSNITRIIMKLYDVHQAARKTMKDWCRVCRICDGRACAGELPGMGGTSTGSSFIENVASLARCKLHMRSMNDGDSPDTTVSFFGVPLTMPVMIAPLGTVSFLSNNVMSDSEILSGLHGGAQEQGILCWGGDAAQRSSFDCVVDAMRQHKGRVIPTIKPRQKDQLLSRVHECLAENVPAIAIDVDACCFPCPKGTDFTLRPWSAKSLGEIISSLRVPVIIKGIMTVDEALEAVAVGASGIVVSNHGGRALDGTPGTAEVLAAIANEVKGKITIFVDGGVRTGTDVLKMLALGADAVLIGRPLLIAAIGGGEAGVTIFLDALHKELCRAMVWTGTKSVRNVSRHILYEQKANCNE